MTHRKPKGRLVAATLSLTLIFSTAAVPALAAEDTTVPAMPDGEQMSGEMGSAPGGDMGGMGGSTEATSYPALYTYSTDTKLTNQTIKSTGTDENVIMVTDGTLVLEDSTVSRISANSTGGDNSSFYGVGAAILATGGTAVIDGAEITTDAAGGAGAFAYGEGIGYIANSTISTTKDTSGGVHVAGGGALYAWDLTVTTKGESSVAIRSDRGSGTMVVNGGTYTSNGTGSPAIYSTADITVNNATLTANKSEAICIEGLNTIRLFNSNLTGSMLDDYQQNDCTWTVIVYQSMSGDSEVGCGVFEMVGGKLTSTNGGLFYTTNTESEITLNNVDITAADDCEFFLRCTGNANQRGWGTTGSNGADCDFTAIDQVMNGDIIWDSISQLDFYMTENSTLTGAVVQDNTYAGTGGSGYANIYIDATSKRVVTGNSVVSNLNNSGKIVDADGKTVTIVGANGTTYVKGDSKYTITVDNYTSTASTSGAREAPVWNEYAVTLPTQLGGTGELKVGSAGSTTYSGSTGNAGGVPGEMGGTGEGGETPPDAPGEGGSGIFQDVSESDPYYEAAQYVYEQGLMQGTGNNTFAPNATLTRGMLATILWRLENEPAAAETMSFTDVADGQYYHDAVAWAAENGIVEGYNEASFGPEDSISIEELLVILYRYALYKGCDVSLFEDLSLDGYTDAGQISSWALPAMRWASGMGLFTDGETTLTPTNDASRAQVAVFLQRFLESDK